MDIAEKYHLQVIEDSTEALGSYYLKGRYVGKYAGTIGAFERMEEKADNMLDKANAMADLNSAPVDAAKELEKKYAMSTPSVEDELAELKSKLGK